MSRFDELLAAYLDGAATDAEADELAELVRGDPELEKRYCDAAGIDGILRSKLAGEASVDVAVEQVLRRIGSADDAGGEEEFVAGVMQRVGARRERTGSSRMRRRSARPRAWSWVSIAAITVSAAAAVVLVIFFAGRPATRERTPNPIARGDAVAEPEAPEPHAPSPSPETVAVTDASPAVPRVARDEANVREPPADEPTPSAPATTPGEADDAVAIVQPAPPDEPGEPIAAPVPPPATTPAPAARPATEHVAYLDAREGDVEVSRAGAGTWAAVAPGAPLSTGDRLRTKHALARVAFESGTALHLNHFTTLTIARTDKAVGLSMVGGEVYVETVEADVGFWVETPHGKAVDLGTRFGVDARSNRTTVTTVEGSVEASTDEASVTVREHEEVLLLRRTSPPGAVRKARGIAKRFSWVEGFGLAAGPKPVALYVLNQGSGLTVRDVSRNGTPGDLALIGANDGTRWAAGYGLSFTKPGHKAILTTGGPCRKLFDTAAASQQLTVEAWIRPGVTVQEGPARVVVYEHPGGGKTNLCNWELDHGNETDDHRGAEACFRLRTSDSRKVFLATQGGVLEAGKLHHVVCTYKPFAQGAADGGMRVYVDGTLRASNQEKGRIRGDGPFPWSPDGILSVGNRHESLDRPWLGTVYAVAVYDRALESKSVRKRWNAGLQQFKRKP